MHLAVEAYDPVFLNPGLEREATFPTSFAHRWRKETPPASVSNNIHGSPPRRDR